MSLSGVDWRSLAQKYFSGQQGQNPLYDSPPAQSPTAAAPSTSSPAPTPQSSSSPSPAPSDGASLLYGASAPKPPMSAGDFAAANPDASKAYMPPRPVGPFDKLPEGSPGADSWGNRHNVLRHALASLFAGAAEFGGDLNHHPGAGEKIVEPWMQTENAQRQYDNPQNQERMKAGALSQAYQTYLGQQQGAANVPHTQAETGLIGAQTGNLALNPPGKQEFLKELQDRRRTGADDPQQLFNEYAARAPYAHTTRQEVLDIINHTPENAPSFKIGPQGIREPITWHGKQWYGNEPDVPEAIKNAATTAGNVETKVHSNKIEEQQATRSNIQLGEQFNVDKTRRENITKEDLSLSDSQERHDQLANAVQMAQKGNVIQAQNAVLKTLGLSLDGITKRINTTELAKFEQAGSLGQRIAGQLRGWTEGNPFPTSVWNDIQAFADEQLREAQQKHDRNVSIINKNYGGPESAAPSSSAAGAQGGTDVIYARDPQGKLHKAAKGTALPQGWKAENAPAGQ